MHLSRKFFGLYISRNLPKSDPHRRGFSFARFGPARLWILWLGPVCLSLRLQRIPQ